VSRQWTDELHELVQYERDAAYVDGFRAGYGQALVELAERADALDVSWRPVERRTHEQVLADRIATMARFDVAAWMRDNHGRHERHDERAIIAGCRVVKQCQTREACNEQRRCRRTAGEQWNRAAA
jgi:hypothetical protein